MKKILAIMLALIMVFSMAACAAEEKPTEPETNDPAQTETQTPETDTPETDAPVATDGQSLSVCLASEPDTLDPALNSAVDGATMAVHLFAGMAKWVQNADGTLSIAPDCATELPEGVMNADGTVTYTYTLKDGLKWSDGQPLTAGDFEFSWKRAASTELAADYGYMFEVVDGYADGNLNVKALDDKTLEVTLANAVAYWNELMAFPTYFPVREDVVANEAWATDPSTYVCNGAYTMSDWAHNSVITLTKNENYHDAAAVTMPEIKFYLSDDNNNMLTNFKNGDWQMIDDIPTNEIASLKEEYPDELVIAGQIGTYYVCWNVNEEILPAELGLSGVAAEEARQEIRNAISLLFDRNYIVEEIAQGGQVPASSFVAMGMTNPDGTQFYQTTGVSSEFDGYYNVALDAYESNFSSAIDTLKKYYTYDEATGMFTNFPSMDYLYNTNEAHKAIGEYLQAALAGVGINMNLVNQEWATFLNTRKEGDYSIARNGWVADYTDPICFLDMWTTISGNNDVQYGKGAHADLAMYDLDLTEFGIDYTATDATWAETYDVLISEIKACTDTETRYALMHVAEDMLMATGAICPIYFYTDLYMVDDAVEGFYSIPLGYKFFMYSTVTG